MNTRSKSISLARTKSMNPATRASSKSVSEASQIKEDWLAEKKKQHEEFQEDRRKIKIAESRFSGRKPEDDIAEILS